MWDGDTSWGAERIVIDSRSLEQIKELVKDTASGGPEYCGNMKVGYNPYFGYAVKDFVRDQDSEHSEECIPRIGDGQGIWHTHPLGLCTASEIDFNTMIEDAEVAIRGITPGIPPIDLVMTLKEGELCIKGYLPTWRVRYKVLGTYPYIIESIGPVVSGNIFNHPAYDYYGIYVEEKEDVLTKAKYYSIKVLGELQSEKTRTSENYGVYVGSQVPPHGFNVILAFMSQFRKEFWVYHELYGLMRIRVESAEPTVAEVQVSVESIGFGREKRLERLEKDHGYPLSKVSDKTAAVLGIGFLGTRVVEALGSYVGKLIVVDIDGVGSENLGYQSLYSIEDLGKYKVNAIASELLKRHLGLRVVPVRSLVPLPMHGLSQVLEDIVSKSDLVIVNFDTFEPRLTVQLAANKYRKPLIDIAVEVDSGNVWIWYPGSGLSCIGCYIVGKTEGTVRRSVYASRPQLASILSGIATEIALNILLGKVPKYNRVRVSLNGDEPKVETSAVKEDSECPYHREKCEVALELADLLGDNAKIVLEVEPWRNIDELAEELTKSFVGPLEIVARRRDESESITNLTVASLCQLRRLGYQLLLRRAAKS